MSINFLDPLIMEMRFNSIMADQEVAGWCFDKEAAGKLIEDLDGKIGSITDSILAVAPKRVIRNETVKTPHLKGGKTFSKSTLQWYNMLDNPLFDLEDVCGQYCTFDVELMNLNSVTQVKEYLLSLGWIPTEFNYKKDGKRIVKGEDGKPIVTSPKLSNLDSLQDGVGGLISKRILYSHRRNQIRGWVERVRADGRLEAGGYSCSTNTARVAHRNIVNVPKASDEVFLGRAMRSLFTCKEGYTLVGADLDQLEARIAAHYTKSYDGGEYADLLLSGNMHEDTARTLGVIKAVAKQCVPMDTLALTRSGWKSYDQLVIGEDILVYDQANNRKLWSPLLDLTKKTDEVIEIKHRYRTLKATKDHRWFINRRKRHKSGKSWQRQNGHYMIPDTCTTEELNTETNIITNAPMVFDNKNSKESLCQIKYSGDNMWVERVLSMSEDECTRFLEGFLIADGYISKSMKGSRNWKWSQVIGEHFEAALLASYLVSSGNISVARKRNTVGKPMASVNMSLQSHITCQRIHKSSLGTQDVWCPTTKYGSWVMRQGDVITITGNCNYALQYGAQIPKLASILNIPLAEASAIWHKWWEMRGSLSALKEDIIRSIESRGYDRKKSLNSLAYVKTIDGRPIFIRSWHSVLNALIQSTGSILFKEIVCRQSILCREKGLDVTLVGNFHDELNCEVLPDHVDKFKEVLIESCAYVNAKYKLRVPLTMDIKIGKTWADVH